MKKLMCFGVVVSLSLFLINGCAGPSKMLIGKQTVVETSAPKPPSWILIPFEEKNDTMYFSGAVKGVYDYAVGVRQAKAEAVKNIVESVKTKARTEFVSNTQGSNLSPEELGKFVSDGVAMTADNLEVSGIMSKETYYEKVEEITEAGVKYFYNCYVLLALPVKDYKIARQKAIENLAAKARAENNKKAEETAKNLLEKLTAK